MIGYLKGKVLYSDAGTVLLENNGVGYELLCSGALFAKLVNEKQGEAYTYLQVREDGLSLFGFVSPEEKNMFLKLITVSGVGPKMGIAILSAMNINDIAVAIATSDVKMLTAVKGLGKKTAELIVLNLREQVAVDMADASTEIGGSMDADVSDAVFALVSLGVSNTEAVRAVQKAKETASGVSDLIATALKFIG